MFLQSSYSYISATSLKNNELSILCINVHSLISKFDEFLIYLNGFKNKPSIIVVTESWLNNDIEKLYNIKGYSGFFLSRDSKGGGIIIYANQDLKCPKLITQYLSNTEDIESIGVSFYVNEQKHNVLGIYRRPAGNNNAFLSRLTEILSQNLVGKTIIAGDFNIDILKTGESTTLKLKNIMSVLGFSLCVSKPTRLNLEDESKSTLIDQIWTNFTLINPKSTVLLDSLSDHYGILLQHDLRKKIHKIPQTIQFRQFNDENLLLLKSKLNNINWSNLLNNVDADKSCSIFYNTLYKQYDDSFPIKNKTIMVWDNSAPWITSTIKKIIKNKNILFTMKKSKLITNEYYNNYCKIVRQIVSKAKADYYSKKFNNANNKTKWHNLNLLTNRQNGHGSNTINELIIDDTVITEDQEIVDCLNNHFATVGTRTAQSIIQTDTPFSSYLRNENPRSFKFFNITENEIIKAISEIKKDNKTPLFEVPNFIYKRIGSQISKPLCMIFNKSIKSGKFPTMLKSAKVMSIFKGGCSSSPSNYRGISILPPISKIFEKIVHKRLLNFLIKYKILNKNQYGFLKNKSTTDALHTIFDQLYSGLNNSEFLIAIYLDIAKAFDCMSHDIMLHKLWHYGIRGTEYQWFKSYLADRQLFMELNGKVSKKCIVNIGVPQGSVLGPLLFIVFINDIYNSCNLFMSNFADDTCIVARSKSLFELNLLVNINMQNVFVWLCANSLKLNIEKTKYTIFTNKRLQIQPVIKINNNVIEKTNCTKLLGVFVDSKLNFAIHISKLCSKLAFCGHILNKLDKCISVQIKKQIYYAFAAPLLEYAISLYGSTSKTSLAHLQVIQNMLIRNIYPIRHNNYISTSSMYKELSILNISQIYELNLACYMYKAKAALCPTTIKDIIISVNKHSYNTRNKNLLKKPQYTKTISTRSLAWQAPNIWNKVPESVKNVNSYKKFRSSFKLDILKNI